MTVVTLTTTSATAQTWPVPSELSVGAPVKVEAWGTGSGGSGGNTSNRAGGAGGAFATAPAYIITPNDVTNGISYLLKAGGAGSAGANSTLGPDTSFSTNNLNTIPTTAVTTAVGGSPGSFPTNWIILDTGGLTQTIVGSGIDVGSGLPYVDVRFNGTTGATFIDFLFNDDTTHGGTLATCTAGVSWTASFYVAMVGGSATNLSNYAVQQNYYNGTSYLSTQASAGVIPPWATTLSSVSPASRITYTATSPASTTANAVEWSIYFNAAGLPVDVTFRIAAPQLEQAAAASFWKSTPGYCLAKGGSATSGTTGGVGGLASACVPTTGAFNGGSGATRTQGGGGGGSAGPQGAGGSSTTGTGGTGDNGSGGAANTSNVLGGGGATAGNPAGTPGNPGGGGGANTSTGTGTTGGRGQIQLTFLGTFTPNILDAPLRQRVEMIAY